MVRSARQCVTSVNPTTTRTAIDVIPAVTSVRQTPPQVTLSADKKMVVVNLAARKIIMGRSAILVAGLIVSRM